MIYSIREKYVAWKMLSNKLDRDGFDNQTASNRALMVGVEGVEYFLHQLYDCGFTLVQSDCFYDMGELIDTNHIIEYDNRVKFIYMNDSEYMDIMKLLIESRWIQIEEREREQQYF